MSRPARLTVGVVSAGRVGSVLGAALSRAGHIVTGVSAVSAASQHRAAELLGGVDVLPPPEVAARADLLLLAVPDDALAGTVRGLVATESVRHGQILVHTSGALGVEVFAPAAELDVLPLALHPAMTFTGRAEDLERLATCCFGVTTAADDEIAWNVAQALVVEMGGEPVRVPEASRALYHAALVHGANHLMTLVTECAGLLAEAGIEAGQRLMGPLLSASLDNALRYGDRALTGPTARGDSATVRAHLVEIGSTAPDSLPVYRALARRTADRAHGAGLLPAQAHRELLAVLEEER